MRKIFTCLMCAIVIEQSGNRGRNKLYCIKCKPLRRKQICLEAQHKYAKKQKEIKHER